MKVQPIHLALTLLVTTLHAQAPTPATVPAPSTALPVYVEEFFLSEAVRSEYRGELQLTAAAFRNHASPEDGTNTTLDIEYGLTGRLQLSVELPYGIRATPTSNIPDSWSTTSIAVLYQFIRSNHPFALSAAAGVDLPVTNRGETGFEPEILAAKAFGKLQIHTSFAPEFSSDGNTYAYNVAAIHPLSSNIFITLEFNARRAIGIDTFYLTPGIYKQLPHRLEAGIGLPIGVTSRSSPIGTVFKVTYEMGGDDDDD